MASITTQEHGSSYFSQIVTSFFNKCKYVVPSVFNGSAAEEAKFFAEIFSDNFDLDELVSFYLVFLPELI